MKGILARFRDNKDTSLKARLKRHWFLLFTVLSFVAFTAYYMGPSVTACNDTVYGFGDNTSGPIWRFDVPKDQTPLGNYQDFTNHPFGEDLFTPVAYSLVLQSSTLWLFDKIGGAVCGYNLVNAFGFITAALTMFGFIYWLTRNRWISWLSGYIVAFAPYFQYKVGGHPSYGYIALLIGVLWLSLKVLAERRKRDAVLLGLVTGACFYWDPYFTLLAATVIVSIGLAWLVYSWVAIKKSKHAKAYKQTFILQLKRVLLAVSVIVAMLIPLLMVKVVYSSQINSYVSGARGDVMVDAQGYSNLPWDYVLPADDNWIANKIISPKLSDKIRSLRHGGNPSEYTVSISIIVLTITALGLLIFAWEKLNGRQLFKKATSSINLKFALWALLILIVVAAALALPPMIGKLKMPSYFMLSITEVWRVLNRFYILVSIGITAIFAIIMLYFSRHELFKKAWLKIAIFILIFLTVFVQYQSFAPFQGSRSTFSYSKDLSGIFYWLRDQKDINYIAGYPIDKVGESEAISHYISVQRIHGKKLLNSTLPTSPQERLRFSIKDLTDPQTLPILRYLGVDALEIHGIPKDQLEKIPGITILQYEFFKSPITGGYLAVAKINDGPKLDHAIVLESGFPLNGLIMKSAVDIEFETQDKAVIKLQDVIKDQTNKAASICFEIKTADPQEIDEFSMQIGDRTIFGPLAINATYQTVRVPANEDEPITLHSKSGHNMRINNVGCQ